MGLFANFFGSKKEEAGDSKVQTEAPKEQAAGVKTNICTNCGAINTDGEKSCKDCATPF